MMLCPQCGSQIPDDVQACPQCRARIAVPNTTLASTDVSRDLPQQEKRIRTLLASVLVIVALGWATWMMLGRFRQTPPAEHATPSKPQAIPIMQGPVALKTGEPATFAFVVPSGCQSAALEGRFDAGSEAGNSAPQMTVFDEASFTAWKNHQAARAVYSAHLRPGTMDLSLPATPQRYVLVFTRGGAVTPIALRGEVHLNCFGAR